MPKPPAKQGKPPDPAQVRQVSGWILQGQSAGDIREAIAATFPEADAAALLVHAMEGFRSAARFDPEIVRGFCFEQVREILRRATESNDNPTALRAVKTLLEMADNVHDRNADADENESTAAEDAGADDRPSKRDDDPD